MKKISEVTLLSVISIILLLAVPAIIYFNSEPSKQNVRIWIFATTAAIVIATFSFLVSLQMIYKIRQKTKDKKYKFPTITWLINGCLAAGLIIFLKEAHVIWL